MLCYSFNYYFYLCNAITVSVCQHYCHVLSIKNQFRALFTVLLHNFTAVFSAELESIINNKFDKSIVKQF